VREIGSIEEQTSYEEFQGGFKVQGKAILIDKKDNVATALCQLESGDSVQVGIEDYTVSVVLLQNIPFGHKFALKDIQPGEAVTKYGEAIGLATKQIRQGEHVHIHNVESQKGRGDKR
jgi:altronate dehydratase small subunit